VLSVSVGVLLKYVFAWPSAESTISVIVILAFAGLLTDSINATKAQIAINFLITLSSKKSAVF
jgi:ABC-type iron transport system FetAB permease component